MDINTNALNFYYACFAHNNIAGLQRSLALGCDAIDCLAWGINPAQWRIALQRALAMQIKAAQIYCLMD